MPFAPSFYHPQRRDVLAHTKNKENGERRLFTQPDEAADHGWIKFLYSIVKRFVALRGLDDKTTPLSVYRDETTGRTVLS
jgi:hypothetical protein